MSLDEQIIANLAKLAPMHEFALDRVWLTFYLSGSTENLRNVAETLAGRGWSNIDGWDGGFLYPKLEADRTAAAIGDIARVTIRLCDAHHVKVLNIDADTSPNVQSSRFVTLYRSDL